MTEQLLPPELSRTVTLILRYGEETYRAALDDGLSAPTAHVHLGAGIIGYIEKLTAAKD